MEEGPTLYSNLIHPQIKTVLKIYIKIIIPWKLVKMRDEIKQKQNHTKLY